MILAAGKGTRMDSDIPKVMHKVNGIPMLVHVINKAKNIGANKIITVIGYKGNLIEKELSNTDIDFVEQKEQLGTGHAVLQCKGILSSFNGNVIILSGDVPLISNKTLKCLIDNHQKSENAATIITADLNNPAGYGRIIRDNKGLLEKIVEHKDATENELDIHEINSGIYAFDCSILFKYLPKIQNNNNQGEYYLPDVLAEIIENKLKVGIEKTKNIPEIQGVNTIEQLNLLNDSYAN